MEKTYKIVMHTDREALSYSVGEEITVKFSLSSDNKICPAESFSYTLISDSGLNESGEADGADGEFSLSFTLTRAGYARISVTALTDDGEVSQVFAICAGFDEITVSGEEPDDFDEFWAKMLSRLDSVPPEAIEIKEFPPESEFGKDGFCVYHVTVKTNDTPAMGFLTIPAGAAEKSLPIFMLYNGYGCGANKPCPNFDPKYITFNVCSHTLRCDSDIPTFDKVFNDAGFVGYALSADDYADPSKAYFVNMILRDIQGLRYAKTLPEWNGEDIIVVGGSQGGMQTLAVTSLCPEVTWIMPGITWMCNVCAEREGLIASSFLPEYTDNLRYFDSVFFARRIKDVKAELCAGLVDPISPIYGITAMYHSLKGCDKWIEMFQSAEHGGWTEENESFKRSSNDRES